MMSDKEFAELELRATICPGQTRWPAADLPHWQRLHQAANEARSRVSKAHMQMDEIDRDADLSPDDKYRKRSMTADQAIADLEASDTLMRAREAVASNQSPATLKALEQTEIGWRRALDKIAERAGKYLHTRPAMHERVFWGAYGRLRGFGN